MAFCFRCGTAMAEGEAGDLKAALPTTWPLIFEGRIGAFFHQLQVTYNAFLPNQEL
jgi:hypothetical protein